MKRFGLALVFAAAMAWGMTSAVGATTGEIAPLVDGGDVPAEQIRNAWPKKYEGWY